MEDYSNSTGNSVGNQIHTFEMHKPCKLSDAAYNMYKYKKMVSSFARTINANNLDMQILPIIL